MFIYPPVPNGLISWTGKARRGGQTIQREVPIDIMPVYVNAGSAYPTQGTRLYNIPPKSNGIIGRFAFIRAPTLKWLFTRVGSLTTITKGACTYHCHEGWGE